MSQESMIATDNPLDADQESALAAIVGAMIPASDEYAVPSATDPTIFADILTLVKRHPEPVIEALEALEAIAHSRHSTGFNALDEDAKAATLETFRQSATPHLRAIVSMTAQCYYRRRPSNGLPRHGTEAPFPQGLRGRTRRPFIAGPSARKGENLARGLRFGGSLPAGGIRQTGHRTLAYAQGLFDPVSILNLMLDDVWIDAQYTGDFVKVLAVVSHVEDDIDGR